MKFPRTLFLLSSFSLSAISAAPPALAQAENAVSVETLAQSTTSWDGSALPAYPAGTAEVTVLRYNIPPDTTLPWHLHPVINAGVIISGNLTVVTKAGAQLHLSAGDALVETVDTWHQGINEGPEPVDIIVFYAGIVNEPLTLQEQ